MYRKRLKSFDYSIFSLALLFVCGILGGCFGAKVIHTTVHPSFTFSKASSGEIGIFGITSIVGTDEQKTIYREHLPSLLAKSIHKYRKKFEIFAPEKFRELLPEENYSEIFRRYEGSGVLDTSAIITLFNATGGKIRYVIIGRVEKDELEWVEYDDDEEETKYEVTRTIEISLEIYDIQAGKQVFKSLISNQESDDITHTNSIISSIIDLLLGVPDPRDAEHSDFPPRPEIYEVAKDIFNKFADILPAE